MTDMNLVGFAGFQEEGEDVYLYQCPQCRRVIYSHIDTPLCYECTNGIEERAIHLTKKEFDDLMKSKYEEGHENGYNDAKRDFY